MDMKLDVSIYINSCIKLISKCRLLILILRYHHRAINRNEIERDLRVYTYKDVECDLHQNPPSRPKFTLVWPLCGNVRHLGS